MTALDLIEPWSGPYGGVPPFDAATPELVEEATLLAMARKRAEIAAIGRNGDAATFANTIEPLEDAGRALKRAVTLEWTLFSTRSLGTMPEVHIRLAPQLEALEDEIAQDQELFSRVECVWMARDSLTTEQARLVQITRERMLRRGAGLAATERASLSGVNAAIAAAQARFHKNMIEDAARYLRVDRAEDLLGLPQPIIAAAAQLAEKHGFPGRWALGNTRSTVWPVLQRAQNRALRRRVREMWVTRCAVDGPCDNRPVIAEIVRLRGEKARLLGYPSFAHWACAGRMARTPDTAMAQLKRTYAAAHRDTLLRRVELQQLAAEDGIDEPIQAWDWLYYVERYRQRHFGLDADAVKPYLTLQNVLAAILEAASRLHGLQFRFVHDVPTVHPDVRVVEVSYQGETVGLVWLDLLLREGKMRSSWQFELRAAETFRGRVIPLSNVCSNIEGRMPDGTLVMGWEYANVLFHEFGHALHMIMSRARYPSLGSMGIEWDMVELPSQLNERWLYDRALIVEHFRHYETGEPLPDALIAGIEAAFQFDRVFSVGLEYLLPAIVDLELYLAADGSAVDPLAIERRVYEELDAPKALDPVFFLPHQYHSFTDVYAAGLYSYLWADVMVAEAIEAFLQSPGGLYDEHIAKRWRDTILTQGTRVPGIEAFRNFRGRDPQPDALLRRFALI